MTGRVLRLDEATINQIAAGEVVERPASVVKELVENSLDAGARRIVIECAGAGKELVRVTDDGRGMLREDAVLALERHTTSKLSRIEQLADIETLGFRGEALPSMAAVSRLEILTRPREQLNATRITSEPSQTIKVEETAGPAGTAVTVRQLFFNVPARAKFLRSRQQETSQIVDSVTRLALAHPAVSFRLIHEGRVLLNTSGSGQTRNALAEVWGRERVNGMLPISWTAPEGVRIRGWVGAVGAAERNRRHQLCYVNGRAIRSGTLRYGIDGGYQGLLPVGYFAPVMLLVELPGAWVDINVHPAKWEARFWDDRAMQNMVTEAVRQALGQPYQRSAPNGLGSPFGAGQSLEGRNSALRLQEPLPSLPSGTGEGEAEALSWQWLGQAYRRYILAYDGQRLWAVDQHAAAERLCYLRLAGSSRSVSQMLLEPQRVELSREQIHLVEERLAVFQALGFDLEPFGEQTLVIRAIPASLTGVPVGQLVLDALGRLLEQEPTWGLEEARLALAACHGSLRAGQTLSPLEMQALIRSLWATTPPYVCPHGRPVVVELPLQELDRRFGR